MRIAQSALPLCLASVVFVSAGAHQPSRPPDPTAFVPSSGVEVPLRLVRGRPLVDVRINGGGPYTFLFDTGAAGDARADSGLVEKLKLTVIGESRGGAPGGQIVTMPIVQFDTIEIGAARWAPVAAPSRDYNQRESSGEPHIDGILGLGLFADSLVTLDFPRGVLRIAPGALPDADGRDIIAFENPRRVVEITFDVAGTTVTGDLDTGGPDGVTLPGGMMDRVPLAGPAKVVAQGATVSGSMDISEGALRGTVTVGRYSILNPTIQFVPPFPHANLGIALLSQFALTVDQKNKRVRLAHEGNAPIVLKPRAERRRRVELSRHRQWTSGSGWTALPLDAPLSSVLRSTECYGSSCPASASVR